MKGTFYVIVVEVRPGNDLGQQLSAKNAVRQHSFHGLLNYLDEHDEIRMILKNLRL